MQSNPNREKMVFCGFDCSFRVYPEGKKVYECRSCQRRYYRPKHGLSKPKGIHAYRRGAYVRDHHRRTRSALLFASKV